MSRPIPSYELYGDLLTGTYSDPLHYEPLRDRSSRHDWTIRLHRHSCLAQVFVFHGPGVRIRLGETDHVSAEPTILVVPPDAAHGFVIPEDAVGDVLTLPVDELDPDIRARLATWGEAGGILPRGGFAHFDRVAAAMAEIRDLYVTVGPERPALLRALARLVLLYAADGRPQLPAPSDASDPARLTRDETRAEAFCAAVERSFATQGSVAAYAGELGISAPQLTRICRRILGASPNALVRRRRMVEARRLLRYSRLPIAIVAHRAGFQDPAFFSRSFKSDTGATPQAYRNAAEG